MQDRDETQRVCVWFFFFFCRSLYPQLKHPQHDKLRLNPLNCSSCRRPVLSNELLDKEAGLLICFLERTRPSVRSDPRHSPRPRPSYPRASYSSFLFLFAAATLFFSLPSLASLPYPAIVSSFFFLPPFSAVSLVFVARSMPVNAQWSISLWLPER